MSSRTPEVRFSRPCRAPAETVYDVLADPGTHLQWGGDEQRWFFRLLSVDEGAGTPATVGTVFTSTGSMPGSLRRWHDRSEVAEAVRPVRFEFVTTASAARGARTMTAVYRHRYELIPMEGGCQVTYTLRQESITSPILRLRLPLVRTMCWRIGIPVLARRGFRNLLRFAERRVVAPVPIR
jgi:uncharacterized protein YndB with AHSA1/START domain